MNSLLKNKFLWGIGLLLFVFIVQLSYTNSGSLSASEINQQRAKYNYQMFCQGCHTPDGTGGNDTPKIKGYIGNFLSTQKGREYLVRVPGSANSTLDNEQLAEVLNWIITEMGGDSVPADMQHYTTAEVANLRSDALFEVTEYRKQVISELPMNQ